MARGPQRRGTSFDRAVLENVRLIRRIGVARLHDRGDLDDFTQAVVLRVYANRDTVRDEQRMENWIAVVAKNAVHDWNAKHRAFPADLLPDMSDMGTSPLERLMRLNEGVAPRTINIEVTVPSVVFRTAMQHGVAVSNPVRDVQRLPVPKKPPRWLDGEEVARLLEAARMV